MALDPQDYAKYEQKMTVNIQGLDIAWSAVPDSELTRIRPIIEDLAEALQEGYRVTLKQSGGYIHLTAKFKNRPDQADVLILKSIGSGLLAATSWGGP